MVSLQFTVSLHLQGRHRPQQNTMACGLRLAACGLRLRSFKIPGYVLVMHKWKQVYNSIVFPVYRNASTEVFFPNYKHPIEKATPWRNEEAWRGKRGAILQLGHRFIRWGWRQFILHFLLLQYELRSSFCTSEVHSLDLHSLFLSLRPATKAVKNIN